MYSAFSSAQHVLSNFFSLYGEERLCSGDVAVMLYLNTFRFIFWGLKFLNFAVNFFSDSVVFTKDLRPNISPSIVCLMTFKPGNTGFHGPIILSLKYRLAEDEVLLSSVARNTILVARTNWMQFHIPCANFIPNEIDSLFFVLKFSFLSFRRFQEKFQF